LAHDCGACALHKPQLWRIDLSFAPKRAAALSIRSYQTFRLFLDHASRNGV
jgi:hypothetical protein